MKHNPAAGMIRTLNGRPCQLGNVVRVRAHNAAWGWRNIVSVSYLDDAHPQVETWNLGELNKALRKSERATMGGARMPAQHAQNSVICEPTKGTEASK